VWCLPRRGEDFVRLACHPTALALAAHVLDGDVLLSNLSANLVGPGGGAMVPHSDQEWAPRPWAHALAMHVIWMIDPFTAENGGTLLVPGSHRRPHTEVRWTPIAAEGPAGTALAFDARLLHGTGVNRSPLGRMGILAYYCRGFIRQQENFALSLGADTIANWHESLRSLFGFTFHPEYLGMVNGPPPDLPRY
jgi:ectoine hydroxylase-related dioxygenase (phytanoyl-CoA dioxygenase family)